MKNEIQPTKPISNKVNPKSKKRKIFIILFLVFAILYIASIVAFTVPMSTVDLSCNENRTANDTTAADCIAAYLRKINKTLIERGDKDAPIDKPLIYIYPTQPTEVSVRVSHPERLTATYPKYTNSSSWTVFAQPNGDLKLVNPAPNQVANRTYYGLYWEGKSNLKPKINDGFVVAKDGLIPFLETKLAILGLSEREANEFIMYWLPILEQNDYNLIRFMTRDEINQNMQLSITPEPDTLIRVMMQYQPAKSTTTIPEQNLLPATRQGFTVVEWGGLRK